MLLRIGLTKMANLDVTSVAPQLSYPASPPSPHRTAASSVECYIYGQCELRKNMLHGKSRTDFDLEKS